MFEFLSFDSSYLLFILFLVGCVAGLVDAIAGGGGLITVPALLLSGIPPITALGTNRLQACIGEATSFLTFTKAGEINFQWLWLGILSVTIGALAGTLTVSVIPSDFLKYLLPAMMIIIITYTIFSKTLRNNIEGTRLVSEKNFMAIIGIIIGFYNGFFGPGTGSIWMIAFILLLGYKIKQATIYTKPFNLTGNLVSFISFAWIGMVDYKIGLCMGVGQIIGSIVGSKLVITDGDRLVRPVFITITILATLKYVYDLYANGTL